MKKTLYILAFIIIYITPVVTFAEEKTTILVEVEGDVDEMVEYIQKDHPFVTIKHEYRLIFNGLALEGKTTDLLEIQEIKKVKAVHDVQEYQTLPYEQLDKTNQKIKSLQLDEMPYSGQGVKVAVIDTGIDYTHPDLVQNYQKGYDIFDMDDDPMETQPHEGIPTEHGTHVAGIIAANGEMKGVAPDADLYAYRALGPGGFGTSVHVLAAIEQAVKDGADIINLSLGNSVNGPDYPTSLAVNKAVDLGVAVVIANGNSGPGQWTVGAPATAEKAIAVGASQDKVKQPYFYNSLDKKTIYLRPVQGVPAWDLTTDYKIAKLEQGNVRNHLVLIDLSNPALQETILKAQRDGAAGVIIIQNMEEDQMTRALEEEELQLEIPIATVSFEDGEYLKEQSGTYMETLYEEQNEQTADFSSRGPVTVNWQIKPDIVAPGTNIMSTVPGGYQAFSGTSMAAPYVSGVLALMKEAYPDADPNELYDILKTYALPFLAGQTLPTTQGNGLIQPESSLEAGSIISGSSLHYGKITKDQASRTLPIKIKNKTAEKQHYHFNVPKRTDYYKIDVPLSFTIEPNQTKEIDIPLHVQTGNLAEGLHEGYISLYEKNTRDEFYLPYLFVHEKADQPTTFGVELSVKPLSTDYLHYQIYVTEELETFTVDLYDPDTLTWQGQLLNKSDVKIGVNEGEIDRKKIKSGTYTAQVTAITKEEKIETYEMLLELEGF